MHAVVAEIDVHAVEGEVTFEPDAIMLDERDVEVRAAAQRRARLGPVAADLTVVAASAADAALVHRSLVANPTVTSRLVRPAAGHAGAARAGAAGIARVAAARLAEEPAV